MVSILYQHCIDIVSIHIARPWRGGRTKGMKGGREGIQEVKKEWKEGRKEGKKEGRKEGREEGRKERKCVCMQLCAAVIQRTRLLTCCAC